MIRSAGSDYTDDENILVLELFMNLDYRRFRVNNDDIIELSEFLRHHGYDRSPGSIKAKLENLKAVNPEYTKDGRKGLPNVCSFLRNAWDMYERTGFYSLSQDAAEARARISGGPEHGECVIEDCQGDLDDIISVLPAGEEREALVDVRVNQGVFRRRVLASFGGSCCITGISSRELLVASHIKPWSACTGEFAWQRMDPGNGLCLNALHDLAFDRGLITIDRSLHVKLSPVIADHVDRRSLEIYFEPYEGKRITPPSKARIKCEYIDYHRENILLV